MVHVDKSSLHRPLSHLLSIVELLSLAGCQALTGLFSTYAPTPTFPPFPQPTPTVTAAPVPTLTPAPPPMIVSRQKQEDNSSPSLYTLKFNYPFLEGVSDPRFQLFNQEVDKIIARVSQDFKNNLQANDATPIPNSQGSFQSVDYSIQYGEHGLVSVLFNVDLYMAGAAHPNQYFATLNLDIASGKVLALKDIFKPGADYLKFISGYAIQDLTRQGRLDWETGAAPNEDNFHSWNITPGGLFFSFDPYQVTAYAMGPQAVTIPYAAMKDLLDPAGPLTPLFQ